MRIRICPECYKAFYILSDEEHIVCPYCGHVFSERRLGTRVRTNVDLTIYHNDNAIPATSTDFSENGAGVIFEGDSIEIDTVLRIGIGPMNATRPAVTIWAKKVSRSFVSAGLRLL